MRHVRREGVVTKREALPLWHDFLRHAALSQTIAYEEPPGQIDCL
jgi:hypothetical protein